MTRVINMSDGLPDEDYVYIGRPSVWGNPFVIGEDGTRAEVLLKYRDYIVNDPGFKNRIEELRGKTLVCHCKPKPCHGDVLVEMLNNRSVDELFKE